MKRRGLLLAIIGMVLLTGWVLHQTGWWDRRPTAAAKSVDPLTTPAGWRYRQNRPHHWRYIMLRK